MTDASSGVRVLHRDAQLLVLYKPAGIATTSTDDSPCLTRVAAELDPDAPHLHASSRLDAEVTGTVCFARTRQAIAALLEARQQGRYERSYVALAAGEPKAFTGRWSWSIDHDPRDKYRRVAKAGAADGGKASAASSGRPAETLYQVIGRVPLAALLLLRPQNGRTHQLRVHAAAAGIPLLGDKHYRGPVQLVLPDGRVLRAGRAMLHCARVRIPDVARKHGRFLTVDAPIPDDMRELWLKLGGDPSLLDTAPDS
jgi:23S rRNA pseudouridine1911/1915/1917 synthase